MKTIVKTGWAALGLVACAAAAAAASSDEIARLGKDLTPLGAEVAGNKEGTIPAYAGGQRTLPAGFKADGNKRWVDPYAAEKPRVTITAANVAQYEDKMLVSTRELFKRFPQGFRMDIYPTHRSAWVPDWINENTIKNATSAKIEPNGYGMTGAFGGIPFPIPKSGIEVWWNNELRYKGYFHANNVTNWMIDSTGRRSLTSAGDSMIYYPVYDQEIGREKFLAGDQIYNRVVNGKTAPASRVGENNLYWFWLDQEKHPAKFWNYTPGTRRVRSAPDLFYDTPCPAYNGGVTMDDIQMTWGPQDRFDWKLVGKKEVFVPYNNYTMQFVTPSEQITTPNFPNPDTIRWELHRAWVIEGTPKKGVRHLYSKKTLYVDEDMGGVQMETYDQAGKLFRAGWSTTVELYDIGVPYTLGDVFFDFSTNTWFLASHPADSSVKGLDYPKDNAWRRKLEQLTPDGMQAAGIR